MSHTVCMHCVCDLLLSTKVPRARLNQHPRWYLHLFERGLLVAILSSKNIRFELRDPDLVLEWDIYNISK
jgi:hypothetical protein